MPLPYVIVMTAYNEQEFISRTMDSVCAQSHRPESLLVVDDGSTDETPAIVRRYAGEYPWIRLVRREPKGRAVGSKVVEAFYAGFEAIPHDLAHEFIVKLDADLEMPPDYFERAARMFEMHDDVGICGGYCVVPDGARWVREKTAPFHIRGAFKAIRTQAFHEIGGFVRAMGWDGIDQMRLFHKGWKVGLLDAPVKHFRPTGSASDSKELYERFGGAYYRRGYDPVLAALAATRVVRRTRRFRILAHIAKGYFGAWARGEEKYLSKSEVRFLRRFQYMRLVAPSSVTRRYTYTES